MKILLNLGLIVCKIKTPPKKKILNKVNFINENFLIDALALKRPIIFTTAHYGNWEILSLAYAAKYGAISIVGKKVKKVKLCMKF